MTQEQERFFMLGFGVSSVVWTLLIGLVCWDFSAERDRDRQFAREQGRAQAARGQHPRDCPYRDKGLQDAWREGYSEGAP